MQILRFLAFCFIICGHIKPSYADGLAANPWGKPNEDIEETSDTPTATLKANPWKDQHMSHLVRYNNANPAESDKQPAPQNQQINIVRSAASGGMKHLKSPIQITTRSELNGGYTSPQTKGREGFSSMLDDLLPSDKPQISTPSFSGGNNAMNFDLPELPDFDKIKRDSTRKFNNATAPIRKMGRDAKDFLEKGSGVKLNEVFK